MYECDDASVTSISETLSLDVADGEINIKEVESAIRSLKYSKLAGADGVTAEMIKYDGVLVLIFMQCMLEIRGGPRRLARCSHRVFV